VAAALSADPAHLALLVHEFQHVKMGAAFDPADQRLYRVA
jgi:hypothetical protein